MQPYNFWQDFFDTYQSLSDWVKTLWLIVPSAFALGLVALMARFRAESNQTNHGITGTLIYSIYSDEKGQFHIVSHAPRLGNEPALFLLNSPDRDSNEPASR